MVVVVVVVVVVVLVLLVLLLLVVVVVVVVVLLLQRPVIRAFVLCECMFAASAKQSAQSMHPQGSRLKPHKPAPQPALAHFPLTPSLVWPRRWPSSRPAVAGRGAGPHNMDYPPKRWP